MLSSLFEQRPAPGSDARIANCLATLTSWESLRDYGRVKNLEAIVAAAVREIKPGSYAGYYIFGRTQIADRARALCDEALSAAANKKWRQILLLKRMARRLSKRCRASYAPGGRMYHVVKRRTAIGKM